MASEYIYVVIYPNGEISYTAEGVTFMCDDPLWIMISPQSCLQQLKNMILMNTGLIGKKEISTLIYRMPVAVASSFTYQKMHIKSDQHVSMMFSYHRSIGSIYSMELCVKLQDVGGSSSSSNNVEEMRNSGAGEGIPFLDTGRGRSPSFNAFVAPAQNTEIPDQRPFPNVHVAYPEGMADGLADSSEEDEIENDSGEEAELVPETQPVQGERVIPSVVEPVNVARVGALSSGTPDHYLHLSLGPMNSTNVEDIPSNYGLTGEMELEVGMKFVNKDAAMLAVKNYNIRRSGEFKVVESDHSRYVCRCKLFGDQCSWMVRVAKTRASRFWEVRKYQGPHTCLASATSQDHAQLDSNVICQHIFPMVQADATICIKVLQGSVESAYGYKVSYKKVWLAKQKAIARIYGDWDESYNQLQRYFNALQTFVPGKPIYRIAN
ncbi:hypothetical protein Ahy_A08g040046 isoform Q [Arachis hypogaea]|uniref:Transposase MuDR plant domain-containing protein n=2 Tax=Arachis hypogaea TaxID=3818 RepID=A0A445BYN6_ARAHY|nr:hypothetical protein Ahy_A08g040046 isoform Q [Arachis hypogaea]